MAYSMKTVGIFFIIFVSTSGGPSCPSGQQYNTCGSACPPTCGKPPAEACIAVCVEGCFCPQGLYKDANGNCVKNCTGSNQTCNKPHQVYKQCGSACEPNCTNPKPPRMCTMQCVKGCFCEKGYLMNSNGNCVNASRCRPPGSNQTCNKPHQVYKQCGSACEPNCTNPKPPRMCTMQCVKGCFCEKGYLMDTNGNCVNASKCPPGNDQPGSCPPNEIWSNNSCGMPVYCQGPTCPNNNRNETRMCPMLCRLEGGCECKKDYYRDNNYKCVKLKNCNKSTGGKSSGDKSSGDND